MLILNCRVERRNKTKKKPTSAPTSGRIIWVKWAAQRSCPGGAVSRQVSLLSQGWHVPRLQSSVTGHTHLPGLWWHKAGTCAALSKWDWTQIFRDEWLEQRWLCLPASPPVTNLQQFLTQWSTMVTVRRAVCTKTSHTLWFLSYLDTDLGCQALRTELLLSILFGQNLLK